MGEVLGMTPAGPGGPGARVRLDSGEVLILSIASTGVRVHQLKHYLVVPWMRLIYHASIANAYDKFTAAPRDDDLLIDTPEKRTAAFLGWMVGLVVDMPSVDVVLWMLPELVAPNRRA